MKRTNFGLLLLGIWSIAVIHACKSDEIDPIDDLMGYYFGGRVENIRLEKKEGNVVSIKAKNVLYKQGISSNGGFEDYYKDFEFPNCEITIIDTVIAKNANNGNQNQFYARIINKDNNTFFGDITKWDSYATGTKKEYYHLTSDAIPKINPLNLTSVYTKLIK